MMSLTSSPLQVWEDDLFHQANIRVWVKRDDLLHPLTGGNKIRKLKGQLTDAALVGKKGVVTFGGAVSNHLVATALLCYQKGIPMRAMVRGEPVDNFTIRTLEKTGVFTKYLSRTAFDKAMNEEYPEWLTIPLGGSHPGALIGVGEIVDEVRQVLPDGPLTLCVPMGTGGTAAGLANQLGSQDTLLIFPAIKGPDLPQEWKGVSSDLGVNSPATIEVIEDTARGGFARKDDRLWEQLVELSSRTGIWWDPVYNGKMVIRFLELVQTRVWPTGSRIILIHTGGLPGLLGYQHRFSYPSMPNLPDLQI
ncbi:MAG: pyridoxal-phosphate dependent enzyme [Saprospiraceae bacterium]|nr:pyridoxal-phosphate dependent enzyme [Saprospiraceae bacterium]